ncbi:MAG: PIN domain-containing protein [Treponema sp.]|jgi:predicted nucleic acid-binding protein|nr:PIN domain-containing protein [Treponema sp.]
MTDKIFVDSNIWIYLFTSEDHEKSRTASKYIAENAKNCLLVISYQVINEVCSVLKKKNFTEPEIRRVAEDMTGLCTVCGNSKDLVFLASELREAHSFSFWDSLIVASAITSRCELLASEDMQDGRVVGGLTIKNIVSESG